MVEISKRHWKGGEIVIELAGSSNQNFMIKSLGTQLRGRCDVSKIRLASNHTRYGELPVIPGMLIALDIKGRTIRTVDPLGLPEFTGVLDKINAITEQWEGKSGPHDTSERANLTDTDMKTMIWEMATLVWANKAEIVHGSMPNRKDILGRDGKLRLRFIFQEEDKSQYASEEELVTLGAGPAKKPTITPAAVGLNG